MAGAVDRSGTQVSGRLALNWQPTAADFVQVSGNYFGETRLGSLPAPGAAVRLLGSAVGG